MLMGSNVLHVQSLFNTHLLCLLQVPYQPSALAIAEARTGASAALVATVG
jgi:hypothetical protein